MFCARRKILQKKFFFSENNTRDTKTSKIDLNEINLNATYKSMWRINLAGFNTVYVTRI